MSSPASTEENTGLFMLRKDSERRATLHRILTDYISHVVSNIQESLSQVGGGGEKTTAGLKTWHFKQMLMRILWKILNLDTVQIIISTMNEDEVLSAKRMKLHPHVPVFSSPLLVRASRAHHWMQTTSSLLSPVCETTSALQIESSWPAVCWIFALLF